jgi:hypothetical protein
MLIVVTPRQMSAGRQRTQVYLWTAVNFIVFNILVSLFRVKNPGSFVYSNIQCTTLTSPTRLSI